MADLRIEKTRKALKRAFLELLEKESFEDITVAELCDLAEVRRATFYTHFPDKYAFLSFYIQEMRNEFVSHFESRTTDSSEEEKPYAYYSNLFNEMLLFFKQHPSVIAHLHKSQMLPTLSWLFTEEIQRDIYQHIRAVNPGDENRDKAKSYFYSGGIMQLLLLWMEDPEHFDEDMIDPNGIVQFYSI